jgi:hypothetical protein
MVYPLEPGGVDYYPVRVGSMLLTMVDPNRGFEKAYNRWYERDHFYDGCMIGPFMFAGSRWVAPRQLKDLRWPHGTKVAEPWDAGSYVSIYWVEEGHHKEHFDEWAGPNVRWLYDNGRGFAERTHVHTVVMDHIGVSYRDDDPVPLALALEHAYPGVVVAWMDGRNGTSARDLHTKLSGGLVRDLLAGSSIHSASSWTPSVPDAGPRPDAPMALGTPGGGRNRLVQLFFVGGDVRDEIRDLRTYTDAVDAAGLADVLLVAPFFRTVVGTDTYADQLW